VPSINEVWEQALQINANLAIIHNDMLDLGNCCKATNGRLDQLIVRHDETNDWMAEIRDLVSRGFETVSNGIEGVHDRQEILIRLAAYQIEQNRTIICALENISKNTCALLNEANQQTALQGDIRKALEATSHMTATAHPEAALAYQREQDQQAALEECCPPEEDEPPCGYQPCREPKEVDIPNPSPFDGFDHKNTTVKRVERPKKPR
jgi:hypothetical protein